MKNLLVLSLIPLGFTLLSCGRINRVESMEGMMVLPPTRSVPSADTSLVRISGEVFTAAGSPRIGRIQRDSLESNNQFQWYLPKAALLCNADFYLSRNPDHRSAISIGLGGAYIGDQFREMFRLGYVHEGNYGIFGYRGDLGIVGTNIYSVRYPWGETGLGPDPYSNYFDPSQRISSAEIELGLYASLILGIRKPESRWGFDLQGSLHWQKIAGQNSIIGRYNQEHVTALYYASITPFVSFDLLANSRIAGGLRMISEFDIEKVNGLFAFFPFVQYEISL